MTGETATGLARITALNQRAVQRGLSTAIGRPLRFVPQRALPDGAAYEAHIASTGQVPTRDNLHDFFNALVWLALPRTKAALNARQAAELRRDGVRSVRGGVRDAATLFDENAALFVTRRPALADALRGFRWRELFVAQRDGWPHDVEVIVFGHALMEKLMAPYKAITAHAWILTADDAYFAASPQQRLAWLDGRLAGELAHGPLRSQCFTPLPVLGIPGWCDANADPAFYDDTRVFRPGRRTARVLDCAPQSRPDSRCLLRKGEESPDSTGQGDG